MAATTRTSFALDAVSIGRLKSLSRKWRVSQAEVVRRALEKAAAEEAQDPAYSLSSWLESGGLVAEKAADWISDIDAEREAGWRD